MPDPTFKIDSTTVLSKSGTTVSVDSGLNIKPAFSSVDNSATNGPSGTDAGATTNTALPIFGCRAWVNFDGTSVDGSNNCAIRASGNVSSVVRTATGKYTITFATAMPDANYCVVEGTNSSGSNTNSDYRYIHDLTTTDFDLWAVHTGAFQNISIIMVSVFR